MSPPLDPGKIRESFALIQAHTPDMLLIEGRT